MRESIGIFELKAAMGDGFSNGPGFLFGLAPAEREKFTEYVQARMTRARHITNTFRPPADPWSDVAEAMNRKADPWSDVAGAWSRAHSRGEF